MKFRNDIIEAVTLLRKSGETPKLGAVQRWVRQLAVVGIFVGVYLGRFIDGARLKKGFGYFIIAMAVFIFIMEFIL